MGQSVPSSLAEFEERFSSEAACIEYLRAHRWRRGFRCPRCGETRAWRLRSRPIDQCVGCGYQTSLTAGTIFEGTRKPLRLWFRVIAELLFSKGGCSALEISRRFGLRYATAWTWLHKLRGAMDRRFGDPLEGLIEVDETYVGGNAPGERRGRSTLGKAVVVGAAECRGNHIGRIRLRVLPRASAAELATFVLTSIAVGSSVRTDGWSGYSGIDRRDFKHQRIVVGNPKNASRLFPRIHRVFSLLDRWILGTLHGSASRKHLQRYLDEFMFRFNRRSSDNRLLLFDRLLENAVGRRPIIFRQLIARTPLSLVAA
jgi:transposase-like protein